MKILHTESSTGWGGQEIRILREAQGMRKRGHEIVLAVNRNGKLIEKARKEGFLVYEIPFTKMAAPKAIWALFQIIQQHQIDIVNTHSSLDAWIGGIATRIAGKRIIRTRHLSTPIRRGINSYLLYNTLVDFVVTTSSSILSVIAEQAKLDKKRLQCIPTGIDLNLEVHPDQVAAFRKALQVGPDDILVGTACFVRSWKGILDLLKAAEILKSRKRIKWVVIGGGHVDDYRPKVKELHLENSVIFTGHLENPYPAIAALDIFLLLSTAHEGISQASLQAAYLQRPLITTPIGGLPEVCIPGKTGLLVSPFSPQEVSQAVSMLAEDPLLRATLGLHAKKLVEEKFTFEQTLNHMEKIYKENL